MTKLLIFDFLKILQIWRIEEENVSIFGFVKIHVQ